MKIRPVGTELFHADRQTDRQTEGQTDMTRTIVAFRNFASAPKKNRHSVPRVHLCVLYGCQKKQRLFPYIELTESFLKPRRRMLNARYGPSLQIYFKLIFVLYQVKEAYTLLYWERKRPLCLSPWKHDDDEPDCCLGQECKQVTEAKQEC
jgi:hypothetical protein